MDLGVVISGECVVLLDTVAVRLPRYVVSWWACAIGLSRRVIDTNDSDIAVVKGNCVLRQSQTSDDSSNNPNRAVLENKAVKGDWNTAVTDL